MCKHKSIAHKQNVQTVTWEVVLEEAEEALSEANAKARKLRSAIKTIKGNIEKGNPFPHANTSSTQN